MPFHNVLFIIFHKHLQQYYYKNPAFDMVFSRSTDLPSSLSREPKFSEKPRLSGNTQVMPNLQNESKERKYYCIMTELGIKSVPGIYIPHVPRPSSVPGLMGLKKHHLLICYFLFYSHWSQDQRMGRKTWLNYSINLLYFCSFLRFLL